MRDFCADEITPSFKELEHYSNVITIFGGARISKESKVYRKVRKLARKLGKEGYSIMTGGGPGIMEAANWGLMQAKKQTQRSDIYSIGLNIQLPCEQKLNPYVEIPLTFEYFFSRKLVFAYNSTAFIVAEGGFGTLDELFEVIVLITTGKHKPTPIILYGKKFWGGLVTWLKQELLQKDLIEDLDCITLAHSPKEVLKILKDFKVQAC